MNNVVDLKQFKEKKVIQNVINRDRRPLHLDYTSEPRSITGNEDFGSKMQRIRSNLERINQLMQDLKTSNKSEEFND